jgi:hypothetical protein
MANVIQQTIVQQMVEKLPIQLPILWLYCMTSLDPFPSKWWVIQNCHFKTENQHSDIYNNHPFFFTGDKKLFYCSHFMLV